MSVNHGKNAARSNRSVKRMEPLITVAQLKERYLFGVGVFDDEGNELPDAAYQSYIDDAVSRLEMDLDIAIGPVVKEEQKDYNAHDYFEWGYFQLNEYPVISIEALTVTYLRDSNLEDITDLIIPPEWIRLDKDTGIIRLLPNNRFPAKLAIDARGAFFPEFFRRNGHVPQLWKINYTFGFPDGKIPIAINEAIAKLAAMQVFSIAGYLILGAGIAGESLSLDGMSESIQSTQSAENSGYSATLKEYKSDLFGDRKGDPHALMTILRNYFKGQTINII